MFQQCREDTGPNLRVFALTNWDNFRMENPLLLSNYQTKYVLLKMHTRCLMKYLTKIYVVKNKPWCADLVTTMHLGSWCVIKLQNELIYVCVLYHWCTNFSPVIHMILTPWCIMLNTVMHMTLTLWWTKLIQ